MTIRRRRQRDRARTEAIITIYLVRYRRRQNLAEQIEWDATTALLDYSMHSRANKRRLSAC